MGSTIYLDHNATTPVDARVFEAMRPYFCDLFGNAASSHKFGQAAATACNNARIQLAQLLNCSPLEIVFTSGATEANNLAIKGITANHAKTGRHIITQKTEHKAIIDPCRRLEREGSEVTWLNVDRVGRINLDELAAAIRPDTILVSIMYANNETGTLQPIREIGEICRKRKVIFHSDATQAVGHIPVDLEAEPIDLLSLSAHKFYGPKGIGALVIRKRSPRVAPAALLDGGGHERGFRSGTLNVPGIVGMGEAARIAREEMPHEQAKMTELRDYLEQGITTANRFVTVNGDPQHRLPHTTNLSFAYVEGESLMLCMDDIAVSSGSACTSASLKPSHVLEAMKVDPVLAHSSIRFGVGRSTTRQELDYVIEKITRSLVRLREMSPLYEMALEGVDLSKMKWRAREQL